MSAFYFIAALPLFLIGCEIIQRMLEPILEPVFDFVFDHFRKIIWTLVLAAIAAWVIAAKTGYIQ